MGIDIVGLDMAIDMVFRWETFMWLAIGIAMGVAGGALPGLTASGLVLGRSVLRGVEANTGSARKNWIFGRFG